MFPRNENWNEGTFGCSPGTKTRNEGTFACSLRTKTGTRAHSPKPPFYETALVFRLELRPCMVLVDVSFGSRTRCFRAHPPWRTTAPLKRPRIATLRRSYRATLVWTTPTPKPPSPRPNFDPSLLPHFRPEFDPILTPNRLGVSKSGHIQGSEGGGATLGRGEGGFGGGGRPHWSGSVAPRKVASPGRGLRC